MDCVFCEIIKDKKELIAENDLAVAFYDSFPVSDGHALVIPKSMYVNFQDFLEHSSDKELTDFFRAVVHVTNLLGLKEGGYRIVMNTGKAAGQEVPHFHAHILGGEVLPTDHI